jgi:hypothetical protein
MNLPWCSFRDGAGPCGGIAGHEGPHQTRELAEGEQLPRKERDRLVVEPLRRHETAMRRARLGRKVRKLLDLYGYAEVSTALDIELGRYRTRCADPSSPATARRQRFLEVLSREPDKPEPPVELAELMEPVVELAEAMRVRYSFGVEVRVNTRGDRLLVIDRLGEPCLVLQVMAHENTATMDDDRRVRCRSAVALEEELLVWARGDRVRETLAAAERWHLAQGPKKSAT